MKNYSQNELTHSQKTWLHEFSINLIFFLISRWSTEIVDLRCEDFHLSWGLWLYFNNRISWMKFIFRMIKWIVSYTINSVVPILAISISLIFKKKFAPSFFRILCVMDVNSEVSLNPNDPEAHFRKGFLNFLLYLISTF